MAGSSRLLIHPIREVTVVTFSDTSILEAGQVREIGEELYELVDAKFRRQIIIDFSNVKSFSSSALGVLITLRKKADEIKGRILICGIRPDLKQIFKLTNLDRLFEFYDNEEKALNAFGVTSAG